MSIEQTNIFSMFDIEDELELKKKAEAEAAEARKKEMAEKIAKTNSEKSTSSKPAEKKTEFKIFVDTIIRYANEEKSVIDYFTEEEILNGLPRKKKGDEEPTLVPISENDLRKRLEDDYPELVPNFTTLVYVEKKNIIIPILQAKKKGNSNCLEESSNIEGSSFTEKKRIPYDLLMDFMIVAKEFSDKFGSEVHGDIYYDYDFNEFFMDFPEQIVNAVSVIRTESAATTVMKFIERKYIKVMEIHSHHTMSPLPSSIDNANERSPILYAIVGRINNFFPEITVRTFAKETGTHISLDPSTIFEHPFQAAKIPSYDTSVVEVM